MSITHQCANVPLCLCAGFHVGASSLASPSMVPPKEQDGKFYSHGGKYKLVWPRNTPIDMHTCMCYSYCTCMCVRARIGNFSTFYWALHTMGVIYAIPVVEPSVLKEQFIVFLSHVHVQIFHCLATMIIIILLSWHLFLSIHVEILVIAILVPIMLLLLVAITIVMIALIRMRHR